MHLTLSNTTYSAIFSNYAYAIIALKININKAPPNNKPNAK